MANVRTSNRRPIAILTAFVLGMTLGCLRDDALAPRGLHAALALQVGVPDANAATVDVVVSYARQPAGSAAPEVVPLYTHAFAVDTTSRQVALDVDIGRCLEDPDRVPADGPCVLTVELTLRDATGAALDHQTLPAVSATPGATTLIPAVTLGVPASSVTVVSGGDQLGIAGQPLLLPVVLLVRDSAGKPVVERRLAIETTTGGGAPSLTSIVTDADGRASIGYQLGPSPGANTFTVSASGMTSRVAVNVAATAVRAPRQSIAAGVYFTCYADVTTRCWGANYNGALGNPAVGTPPITATDTALPVPVSGAPAFVALAAGVANNVYSQQACGLAASGEAWCWGANPAGQLGVASTESCPARFTPTTTIECARTPLPVAGGFRFASLSVAGDVAATGSTALLGERVCGVTTAGVAMCWGMGDHGELGIGRDGSVTVPTAVAGGLTFVQVSTGTSVTCGVTATSALYCWGQNEVGELGTGDGLSSNVPVRVKSGERFAAVGVGTKAACALTVAGDAWCWGASLIANPAGTTPVLEPRLVPGGLHFSAISVGLFHACALTPTGDAYCWGGTQSSLNVLGNRDIQLTSTPVRVLGVPALAELVVGTIHSCGRTLAGALYCWGDDAAGELGSGTRSGSTSVAVRVNLTGATAGAATTITPTTLGTQTSSVGALVPVRPMVRVTDANELPVAGAPVTFTVFGGGSVANVTTVTNSAGLATPGNWRLGANAGANGVTASVQGVTSSVTFNATGVVPGPAQRLLQFCCFSGATAAPGTAYPIVPGARALDANGYPVRGVAVTFTKTTSGGSTLPATPATILTDADGFAQLAQWVIDTVPGKANVIVGEAPGLAGSPITYTVTATSP